MNLFGEKKEDKEKNYEPLAFRMRPRDLEEFIGQEEAVGEGSLLRRALEADKIPSLILFGPPGSGKSSLAQIIAKRSANAWESLSAVTSGVSEVRKVMERAEQRLRINGQQTILFIDEIHRFNKAQQAALLPAVEKGTIILIGATTENPFFEVIPPLLSRCRLVVFKPLTEEQVKVIVERALSDKERGLGGSEQGIAPQAKDFLIKQSGGDARVALNTLELAFFLARQAKKRVVGMEEVKKAQQERLYYFSRRGDAHYDLASAFIKSMRGSDPDAALYYLARMIKAGEDLRFIARRMVIFASEDIGNAQPEALTVALSAFQAVEVVGLPEAALNLAQACIYLSCSPKSNTVKKSLDAAFQAVEEEGEVPVPNHLKSSSYRGARKMGAGIGYKYPHQYDRHYVKQEYLPEKMRSFRFYQSSDIGFEKKLNEFLLFLKGGGKSESGRDNEKAGGEDWSR